MGYRVDVYEKAEGQGGMLTQAIPAFRLPSEVVERELKGMTVRGSPLNYGTALGKEVTVQGLTNEYDAAFLAPGLWSGRRLELPGMDKARASDALRFLVAYRKNGKVDRGGPGADHRRRQRGVGRRRGRPDRCGAGKVTLVCLEAEDEMPCLESEGRR